MTILMSEQLDKINNILSNMDVKELDLEFMVITCSQIEKTIVYGLYAKLKRFYFTISGKVDTCEITETYGSLQIAYRTNDLMDLFTKVEMLLSSVTFDTDFKQDPARLQEWRIVKNTQRKKLNNYIIDKFEKYVTFYVYNQNNEWVEKKIRVILGNSFTRDVSYFRIGKNIEIEDVELENLCKNLPKKTIFIEFAFGNKMYEPSEKRFKFGIEE